MIQQEMLSVFKKSKKNTVENLSWDGHLIRLKRRSYQKSVGLSIKPNGSMVMTCAKGVSKKFLIGFLEEKKEWINSSLEKYKNLRDQYPPFRIEDGEKVLFLGYDYPIRIKDSKRKRVKVVIENFEMCFYISQDFLMELTQEEGTDFLKKALFKFYQKSAEDLITKRIHYFSELMDLFPTSVHFRSLKSRWGSCSSEGKITMNWRLVAAPMEVIDYVVIHEIAHLKHQNHSKRFWDLVEQFDKQFRDKKLWLRNNNLKFDFLSTSSEIHPS